MTTDLSLDTDRTDRLVDRLFEGTVGALELYSVYLGTELGLYRVLHEQGPLTPVELAHGAGITPRYAREWLEQQAVAGLLDVEEPPGGERRFALPPEHARVLVHAEDPAYVAPFGHLLAGIGGVLDLVAHAYRTGTGVPYSSYGRAFRHGQGHINRPAFTHDLTGEWLQAMPDVVERLHAAPRPRIADVGCGQGWSTLALARAFPNARVDGVDLDDASVADARANAAEAGLDGRIRVLHADVARLPETGPYDLVVILEALHDMAQPVEALRAMRDALAGGGAVLVGDERVADTFTAPGDQVERLMYGWSVTHCLPTQLVDRPTAATGTVIRAGAVREHAAAAGFGRCTVLPVEHDFFRFYRLDA
ncbi:trans-aconitate 2-methyltransferase [Nonomuraea sp. C10]|uniref:class I SAM-dependent methyltransferase n=1 Tax=Nonomuraea sp. C10 TaxID=2600577 RepID=UPI0011CE5D9E|nr:class I SAM-dependent methyltransferase [Nonomuraea sp. C10]TXK41092.1 class I SAM-dependent methyltransferase [Nonomuraea sp. C10]